MLEKNFSLETTKFLKDIEYPEDLKKLNLSDLPELADEIREYLIDTISKIGGHLGASLGVVELTIALHYVFNTPTDKIIWDVGHQGYIHKILTGRKEQLTTIRQLGGISGFLKRSESEYDCFGAGHASTSLSAGLGIATARDYLNKNFKVISVIGDGSMTGGMAYEAMNNIGILKKNMIVILNDNHMSIGPNNWAFQNYFTELITNDTFNKLRNKIWDITSKSGKRDRLQMLISRIEGGLKGMLTPGMLFEAMGFRYFGPINGHHLVSLVKLFEESKKFSGPLLIHVLTEKGKGPNYAEKDSQKLHALNPFDKYTGIEFKKPSTPAYTQVFGEAITELAKKDKKIIGITAAMPDGTGLSILQKSLPEKYFDVGIAEQHAVTFAAGMSTEGFTPVVAIYSTFLQRAFDQIIHDVALQGLHVVFAIDRAGLVGADGPTHHGSFDLSYLRLIPNMIIMAPKDESELRDMLYTATLYKKGPVAIRYPRGNSVGVELHDFEKIEIGNAEIVKEGSDIALLAIGDMVNAAAKAADKLKEKKIDAEVINMRFVKPLDAKMLKYVFEKFDKVMTIEDNSILGGFGSAVSEFAVQYRYKNDILIHGLPDKFIEHGKPDELLSMLKLDSAGIAEIAEGYLHQEYAKKLK